MWLKRYKGSYDKFTVSKVQSGKTVIDHIYGKLFLVIKMLLILITLKIFRAKSAVFWPKKCIYKTGHFRSVKNQNLLSYSFCWVYWLNVEHCGHSVINITLRSKLRYALWKNSLTSSNKHIWSRSAYAFFYHQTAEILCCAHCYRYYDGSSKLFLDRFLSRVQGLTGSFIFSISDIVANYHIILFLMRLLLILTQ